MVKTRKEKNIIKEEIHISSFELCVDPSGKFIFIDCPDDKRGLIFLKIDFVHPIFTAA